jgi:ribonuclease BN (tRNA processing enzyme)
MHACGEYSCSLAKLENVFITHSHEDHLDIWNIGFMQMAITKKIPYLYICLKRLTKD